MSAPRRVSWGTGIAIAFGVFGVGLAVMIWIALSSPTDLVADDYYQRGLEYEGRIQSIRRAQTSGAAMTVRGTANEVVVIIPGVARSGAVPSGAASSEGGPSGNARTGEVNGTVTFYRPSDRTMDFITPLVLDSTGTMRVQSPRLQPGLWMVKASWVAGGAEYYEEAKVVLN